MNNLLVIMFLTTIVKELLVSIKIVLLLCFRTWKDTQRRSQRARDAPHTCVVRPVLFRGPDRLQGPGRVHGHRSVGAWSQHEPPAW